MDKTIRVRFAPSPTGGLHLGGVRTALFNYLFAKNNGGQFILRIEDTDQARFVPGAEEYIQECLKWCGIEPDESPFHGGDYGPYRQSERKEIYRKYAEQLVRDGKAYLAFDTTDELELQRQADPNFKYSQDNRMQMRNSLSMTESETQRLLDEGHPHVIRIKMPSDVNLGLEDLIRGHVHFETSLIDDKVLLKADGMPTYHLAVVVDDYLMKITHVIRGEEWLPSAPVHVLLWEYLGWEDEMPAWVHLPLILRPEGNGKLSKRDGDRLGIPVYAMNWQDPDSGDLTEGFRELGFLPEAFLNLLVVLGWNDGTEQEIFELSELIEKFSLDRVNNSGAKFDYEKAKWFNHEWIKRTPADELMTLVKTELIRHGHLNIDEDYLAKVLDLVKERLILIGDFWSQASFFFEEPQNYDLEAIRAKWTPEKTAFFYDMIEKWETYEPWSSAELEHFFKMAISVAEMKIGELMLPLRIMLVGGKFGPHVFDIAATLGREGTLQRMRKGLGLLLK